MRIRSRSTGVRWRGVCLAAASWALPLVAALAIEARAGQPASLSDEAGAATRSEKPVSAVKDSSKKSTAKPTTTAKLPAKPGTVASAKAPAKTAPTVAKTTPTVAKTTPTVAKMTPTVAKTTPTVAKTAPTVAKTTPTVAKGTSTMARTAPRIPSKGTAVGTVARTPVNTTPARISTAGLKPTPVRTGAVQNPSGPALARQGATTVQGPSGVTTPPGTKGTTKLVAGTVSGAALGAAVKGGTPATSPGVSKRAAVATAAPLEDHITYQYNALGRRDPFQSLMEGEFVGADVGGQAPPDLGGLKVVGIVWGSNDQFAMVEDVRGNSYVLRRGDQVMNGYVEGLKRDAMIVNITVDGQSQTVTIPLTRKGEKNANR